MNCSRSSSFESCLKVARSSSEIIQRTSSSNHFLSCLLSSILSDLAFCFFCFSLIGRLRGSVSWDLSEVPWSAADLSCCATAEDFADQTNMVRKANAKKKDRKSTRLNSSHQISSYAVFCLKKK